MPINLDGTKKAEKVAADEMNDREKYLDNLIINYDYKKGGLIMGVGNRERNSLNRARQMGRDPNTVDKIVGVFREEEQARGMDPVQAVKKGTQFVDATGTEGKKSIQKTQHKDKYAKPADADMQRLLNAEQAVADEMQKEQERNNGQTRG